MVNESQSTALIRFQSDRIPILIHQAGESARDRYLEFFAAQIRNPGTRAAYAQAVRQFCNWSEAFGVSLTQISPVVVAAYIEQLTQLRSAPTVKLHLAAIRTLFDFFVMRQIMPVNPALSVRGPKHVVKKGKTPVLVAPEARQLLDSIYCTTIIGLRDRALIAVMVYSFARVSATIGMNVDDYYPQGRWSAPDFCTRGYESRGCGVWAEPEGPLGGGSGEAD